MRESPSQSNRLQPYFSLWRSAGCALQELAPLLAIVFVYVLIVQIALPSTAQTFGPQSLQFDAAAQRLADRLVPSLLAVAAVFLGWNALYRFWLKPESMHGHNPLSLITQNRGEALFRLFLTVVLLSLLIITFSRFKAEIPNIVPFHWDIAFWQLDRALHGGFDPWQGTWWLFGSPGATLIIDRLYISWFVLIHFVLFAIILFDQDIRRRQQYLTTFVLIWVIIGSLFALILSSAGPCYLADLENGNQAFAPLMARLDGISQQHPLVARLLQEQLWAGYEANGGLRYGISAMPSLHVAHAMLLVCVARRYSALLMKMALGYTIVIMIGSVHLGWHYAIDGYFSAFATVVLWYLVGLWMAKKHPEPSRGTLPELAPKAS